MLATIIIFFIAIVIAFGMLLFRAWEIRTARVAIPEMGEISSPDLSFRHVEKSMLYLTKHILQSIVLTVVKYWFIVTTKTKKWVSDKWPHRFKKEVPMSTETSKPSFLQKTIIESRAKIRRIKEKVKREHGDSEPEN